MALRFWNLFLKNMINKQTQINFLNSTLNLFFGNEMIKMMLNVYKNVLCLDFKSDYSVHIKKNAYALENCYMLQVKQFVL